jgi:hypothetical protein
MSVVIHMTANVLNAPELYNFKWQNLSQKQKLKNKPKPLPACTLER